MVRQAHHAMKKASASARATVANVGPGFDLMGLPLSGPRDVVSVCWNDRGRIILSKIEGDGGLLSKTPSRNIVGIVATAMLTRKYRLHSGRSGVTLTLKKGIPIASGLGGSAASSVAAALAVNKLLGSPYPREQLLPFALKGEAYASGGAHLDNVLPCLLEKPVLILSIKPLRYRVLKIAKSIACVVVHPDLKIETKMARKLLPKTIARNILFQQTANLLGMIRGLETGDGTLIRRHCVDLIAEPVRKKLIPGFAKVKMAALKAGAYGCSISGSGPSVFALCKKKDTRNVGRAMQRAFAQKGLKSKVFCA